MKKDKMIIRAYVKKTGKLVNVTLLDEKNNVYMDEKGNPFWAHELNFNVRSGDNPVHLSEVGLWEDTDKQKVEELPGQKAMFDNFLGRESIRFQREEWLRKRIILIQTYIERGDDDLNAIFAKVDRIIEYLKLKV